MDWISEGGKTCGNEIFNGPDPDNRMQKEMPKLTLSPSLHFHKFHHF
jgi:hypothetical protein